MKAAVSIPDPVFKAADELAQRLGVSSSHIYSVAIQGFVKDHDDEAITAKLNEVYDNESSALDPVLQNEVLGSGRKSKVTDSLYRANSKIRFQSLSTFALTPARATGRHVDV